MTLARRLDTRDAVVVGLGAMLGTGVFVVPAPAAAAASAGLLPALALAGLVALLNATSTAALAARLPEAGGVYVYGRELLGPSWGFLAGAAFLAGKTASCAAAALAVGTYVWPGSPRPVAVVAVALVTAADLRGVQRTARATRWLVAAVLAVLTLVCAAAVLGGGADPARLTSPYDAGGVLPAAGLFFFAFAGYARITVLGGEVRDPARTIPRAVRLALLIALVTYAAVSASVLAVLGAPTLADSPAPLAAAVAAGRWAALEPVVRVGGALAALGALLSLVAGVGRTAYAMGLRGDAPRRLAVVDPVTQVPRAAQLAVAAVAVLAAGTGALAGAVAFSAVTVLLYYVIAHLCVLRAGVGDRRVAAAGLAGCLLLAGALPPRVVLLALAVLSAAVLARALTRSGPPT